MMFIFKIAYAEGDPNMQVSAMARLNEIGNLSILQATENSGRLSGMLGIRAAQTNPIEASAISSLKNADASGNAQSNALASALAAMFANLAAQTPAKAG